jgi:hypothetical protein
MIYNATLVQIERVTDCLHSMHANALRCIGVASSHEYMNAGKLKIKYKGADVRYILEGMQALLRECNEYVYEGTTELKPPSELTPNQRKTLAQAYVKLMAPDGNPILLADTWERLPLSGLTHDPLFLQLNRLTETNHVQRRVFFSQLQDKRKAEAAASASGDAESSDEEEERVCKRRRTSGSLRSGGEVTIKVQ